VTAKAIFRTDFARESNVELRAIPFPRLWTHVRLSAEMLLHPPDVLFVPAHVLPLIHPRRSVVTVHDLGYLFYPEAHRPADRRYLDWSTRWNAHQAAAVLADSQATKADLVRAYGVDPAKVHVVYLGRDEALAPVRDPEALRAVWQKYGIIPHSSGRSQPEGTVGRPAPAYLLASSGRSQPEGTVGRPAPAYAEGSGRSPTEPAERGPAPAYAEGSGRSQPEGTVGRPAPAYAEGSGRSSSGRSPTEPAEPASGPAPAYLLYVGTLQPRKNLSRLIEAFARLAGAPAFADVQQSDSLRLVLAGRRGWLYDDLVAQVERLGLAGRVFFPGYVADADLPALYSGALAFVFPSLYEGFGLPVLEAGACGVPVITSNTSSLPEVAGDAALLVDPHDVDAIAEAMYRLVTDEALRAELVRRGFENVKRFSWEKCARETLAVLEEVGRRRV
jgi:glycosyltransferase involved in cell wall biosynthesis